MLRHTGTEAPALLRESQVLSGTQEACWEAEAEVKTAWLTVISQDEKQRQKWNWKAIWYEVLLGASIALHVWPILPFFLDDKHSPDYLSF